MRCPQCSAEQPGGVTVCGFCGAPMVGGPLAAGSRGAARAPEQPSTMRRWLLLLAAAILVGLAIGRVMPRASSTGDDGGLAEEAATAADWPEGGEGVAEPGGRTGTVEGDVEPPQGTRGGGAARLTVERLESFAEELAALAAEGRSRELAARVDPRARYSLTTHDLAGRRELDGGKAELLAHWLAPWLAAERAGGLVDELIDLQSARIAADPRQGILVRRLEAGGDVTKVRYPADLLLPLAARGVLAPNAVAALDLSPLGSSAPRCVATETLRVAAGPAGLRVIEVGRVGTCEP